jgi:mono/diheme cytochrome c family protein
MIALSGLLLFTVGAPAQAAAQGADDPAQVVAGQAVFEMNCAGCHADDGSGVAGIGRPLTGIATQGDRATHVASITNGKSGMPSFSESLTVDEIDQAASYVRLTFVDEAAESAPTELALTGIESTGFAVVGVAMLAGGLQLVVWSRRRGEG